MTTPKTHHVIEIVMNLDDNTTSLIAKGAEDQLQNDCCATLAKLFKLSSASVTMKRWVNHDGMIEAAIQTSERVNDDRITILQETWGTNTINTLKPYLTGLMIGCRSIITKNILISNG